MAGVREDLILDISQASRSIDALEAQVTAAFAGVNITVDTAGIAQEISSATSAADTNLHVTADTTGLASEITRAVDIADSEVDVTADTTVARAQVNALDRDLTRTAGTANTLGIALTGAGLLVGARALFSLAEASSAVNEQLTGSEIVFGNVAAGVQHFAEQADRIGLADAQALQLSNTFGQLALSAGLSGDAVSNFATTIVERGADISSLRDIDLSQTLDALRSGLVGETEPLRNIGIFINEASVQTKAYQLGLADLGSELTDQQKIQARYALILEQSQIAAGNFLLTQDGLANTERQVRAELSDLAADSGRLLEPTFLRLAGLARDDLIPSLAELAEGALPAIGRILEDLAPVLGIGLNFLVAATPLLEITADALDAIPAPLIAIAAGYIALNRARKLADLAGESKAVKGLSETIGGLRVGLGRLDIAQKAVGVGVAVSALAPLVALAAQAGAGNALTDLAGGVIRFGDSLTGFSEGRGKEANAAIEEIIGGLDTNNVAQALVAVDRLTSAYQDVGEARRAIIGGVSLATSSLNDPLGSEAADRVARLDKINEEVAALNAQARAEIETGRDTGRFTQAQIDASEAQVNREDTASPIIRQLQLLQIEEQRTARQAELTIDKYDDVARSYVGVADALGRLRDAAPAVESAISRIRTSGDTSDESFLGLAVAIDAAHLSTTEMADAAAALGIDTDSLAGFVDTLTSALDDFVESAVSGLPTVGDVLSNVQEDVDAASSSAAQAAQDAAEERAQAVLDATSDRLAAEGLSKGDADRIRKGGDDRAQAIRDAGDAEAAAIEANAHITVSQFTKGLQDQAAELADFRSDLAALTAAGFSDVAALLAEQGFAAGNSFADELNAALESGNTGLIESLQAANQAFEDESTETVDFFRNELGPEMISAAGLISSAITESFGDNLDFEEKIRIAAALAKAELDPQGESIAAIAATKGESAARAYGEALKLDKATIDAGVKAGLAIAGIDTATFTTAGRRIGQELGDGIVDGFTAALLQRQTEVSDKAAQLAIAAEHAAKQAAEIESPSKVWARIGGAMGQGLAGGLAASIPVVAAAGASTVASAVPSFGTRAFAPAGGSAGDGLTRLHPDDIRAIGLMRPNLSAVVHNPVASTAEQSVRRELKSAELRSNG